MADTSQKSENKIAQFILISLGLNETQTINAVATIVDFISSTRLVF